MRLVALSVALLALAGCPDKNSPERRMHMAVEKMIQFTDMMCACRDKACADHLQEEMTTWATKQAAEVTDEGRNYRADEATMKKMTEVGQRYGECMTNAMRSDPALRGIQGGGP